MKTGKAERALRIALNNFDEWNDTTGFVEKDTGYYYELQGLIEDAVHVGIKTALDLPD